MKNYPRLEYHNAQFLRRCGMMIRFSLYRRRMNMMMAEMHNICRVLLHSLGAVLYILRPRVLADGASRGRPAVVGSRSLGNFTIYFGEISCRAVFNEEDDDCGGHGDGGRRSSVLVYPKIRETWVG